METNPRTPAAQLAVMIRIASVSHFGQYDLAGRPYILHPLKVMHYLKSDDDELNCIAVGHDLFEDTKVTAEMLRLEGISERVISGIFSVTKLPGESWEEYKAKVKVNEDGRKVKLADLRHNSDIRRLKGIDEKDIARIKKYHEFYLELRDL